MALSLEGGGEPWPVSDDKKYRVRARALSWSLVHVRSRYIIFFGKAGLTGSDKMGNKSIFKITIYTLNLIDQEYKRNKLDNQIKIIVIRVKTGKTVSPVPPDGNEDGFQKTEAQPEPDISDGIIVCVARLL